MKQAGADVARSPRDRHPHGAGLPGGGDPETCAPPAGVRCGAMTKLPLEPDGRALLGVLAHALGQPAEERVVALAPGEFGLTAASPGAASLTFASLDVGPREAGKLSGNYRPSPPPAGELGDFAIDRQKHALVLKLPAGTVSMEELGGDPIDPAGCGRQRFPSWRRWCAGTHCSRRCQRGRASCGTWPPTSSWHASPAARTSGCRWPTGRAAARRSPPRSTSTSCGWRSPAPESA